MNNPENQEFNTNSELEKTIVTPNILSLRRLFYAVAAMAVLSGACNNPNNRPTSSKHKNAVHLTCFKSESSLPRTIIYNGNVFVKLNPHKAKCSSYFEENRYSKHEVHAKVDCSFKEGAKTDLIKQVQNIDIVIKGTNVNCTVK